ncbi:THO2 plays a role in transcriptional elongation, partial [Linderina pennispora]
METTESLCEQPLELNIIKQIQQGEWSGLNDKLTNALLSGAPEGAEAVLCTQLLIAACTKTDSHGFPDASTFAQGVSQWVSHHTDTLRNTTNDDDAEHARRRLSEALADTVWALGVEWAPDTHETNTEIEAWWRTQQMRVLEQSNQLTMVAKALLAKKLVTNTSALQRWEGKMLEATGVVKSADIYNRKYVRLYTTLNFKQTKYNLVREQSEGFSKLLTMIMWATMKVPQSEITPEILERLDSSSDRLGPRSMAAIREIPVLQECVGDLLRNIKGVIGQFSLDPNRVVDILLDCFITDVRVSWAFFLALIDASPWARSDRLAQLVGWRFQIAARSAKNTKPAEELVTVAALLISHDLISLSALYPYLMPSRDVPFLAELNAWRDSLRDSQGSPLNALASMGALEGDGSGGSGDGGEDEEEVKEPDVNQHALLCAKLLAVGDADSALRYLKKEPDMARVNPEIADIVVRMIDEATRSVYEATDCVRLPSRPRIRVKISVPSKPQAECNTWGLPAHAKPEGDGHGRTIIVLTPLVTRSVEGFFYDKFWLRGRLPTATALRDMPRVLAPWLRVAFVRLAESPQLLTRFIRLCRFGMRTDFETWYGFLCSWVVPAYSLAKSMPGLSNELWSLVGALPLSRRYEFYNMWEALLATWESRLPEIVSDDERPGSKASQPIDLMSMSLEETFDDDDEEVMVSDEKAVQLSMVEIEVLMKKARRDVNSVMRRLSGENARAMGRRLCHLCHATPTFSLAVILGQVTSYDNLVEPVVEAFRYLSPMDADILFYLIIQMINDPERDNQKRKKLKPDDVNPAHWLQSLAAFVAAYSHRYEYAGLGLVLEYLLKRMLRVTRNIDNEPVYELVIVSECIRRLAGIEPLSSPTDDQTLALQGGPHLRLEAYGMNSSWLVSSEASVETLLAINTTNKLTHRLAVWLTDLLVEHNLVLGYIVGMCTHAEAIARTMTLSVSNASTFYDREVEHINQLFNLLVSYLPPERYASLVPPPEVLAQKYGLTWQWAVLFGRPVLSQQLAKGLKQWEADGANVEVEIVESDTPAQEEEEEKEDREEASGTETDSDDRQPRVVRELTYKTPLVSREFVDYISKMVPAASLERGITADFAAVFWVLTLYDTEVPALRYKKEIEILRSLIKRIDAVERSASRSQRHNLEHLRRRAKLLAEELEREHQEQQQHVGRIRKWLTVQKDYWFCMALVQRKFTVEAILDHCVLPRSMQSAADASFCAKFLWMMHFPLATNKFSIVSVYDHVFCKKAADILRSMTENETRYYARFMDISLMYLTNMRANERLYNDRALNAWRGLIGFCRTWTYQRGFLPPPSRTIGRARGPATPGDYSRIKKNVVQMTFDDFRSVMFKFQAEL